MIARGTVIAALVVVELAIVGEAGVAIRGGQSAPVTRAISERAIPGRLAEDGPHQVFDAGAHPTLTVDIGYADLTIVGGGSRQIDVSVSGDPGFGVFGSSAPILAHKDGETLRVTATAGHEVSMGDDRMVTAIVPPETQVIVLRGGDIKVSGLRAPASITSVGSGSVTVEDFDAPALHVSSKGRISLHEITAPHLDATSTDDRVEGTGLNVHDGNIESDDRVDLGFAKGTDAVVTAAASDGKVNISGLTSAASPGSTVKNNDEDGPSSGSVSIGGGNGHFDVHANDGNVNLFSQG